MAKGVRRIAGGWQIRFQHAHRPYCKTVSGPDSEAGLKAAQKALESWRKQVCAGEVKEAAPLFGHLAQRYLNGLDAKLSTRQTYRAILNGYWMPTFTATPVHKIRPAAIREHLAALTISQKTKKNILIPLRGVFDLAVEEEWLDGNPVGRVRIKRHQRPQIERFTPAEKAKILSKLDGAHRLYFLILFEAGMRPGEVLALRWDDFDGSSLRVARAIVRRRETDTKTHEARRVHCTPPLKAALLNDPARFQGGPIFRNGRGQCHKDSDEFNRAWKAALASARVPYRIPYTCRHTRASEMLMQNVQPAFAAKQLGHSLEMFFRTYADWINSAANAEQIQKLDAAWMEAT